MSYKEEKKKYISFCGAYCRICDSFTGKRQMTARSALKIIKKREKEFEELFEDENIRDSIVQALTRQSSWLCPGCKALINNPKEAYICKIRQCCSSRNLDLCSECKEFPCEMLCTHPNVAEHHRVENLMEIKKKGIKYWLDMQQEPQKA